MAYISYKISILILTLYNCGIAVSQEDPDCICLQEVETVRDFQNPLVILHAGDGTDRLFVGEQTGKLWVLSRNVSEAGGWFKHEEPFMNVSVYYRDFDANEEGFLAVRFHPHYISNGLLYVWYTVFNAEVNNTFTRLSEFRVSSDDPNKADPEYERVLLEIEQVFFNHNGGDLIFLPDGTLLIFTGDGGTAGDPFNNALNKQSALGKILRIDVDNTSDGKEYAIPDDNPFLDDTEALPELYTIGMRNPWRAFTDPVDGRIFIGDVGQSAVEEIDVLFPGENYGWSAFEGSQCYKPQLCPEYVDEHRLPIHEYYHGITGECIIQGPMYRGCENPGLNDWLIFGDFMFGDLFRLMDNGTSEVWTGRKHVTTCGPDVCEANGFVSDYAPWIETFGVDERSEVYFGASNSIFPSPEDETGRVYKIVDPNFPGPPCEIGEYQQRKV